MKVEDLRVQADEERRRAESAEEMYREAQRSVREEQEKHERFCQQVRESEFLPIHNLPALPSSYLPICMPNPNFIYYVYIRWRLNGRPPMSNISKRWRRRYKRLNEVS